MNPMQSAPTLFSKNNLIFLFFCLCGLVLIFLMSVRPLSLQTSALSREIPKLRQELQEQQRLHALLTVIEQHQKSTQLDPRLPVVKPEPLEQQKTQQVIPEIRKIADKANIAITVIEPLITSDKKDWQHLTIRTEMRGQFADLRPFLLDLLTLPYVDTIRGLEIHSAENSLDFKLVFTVKLV